MISTERPFSPGARMGMERRVRFLRSENDLGRELTLDDVFLVPQFYDGGSRLSVDVSPPDFTGSHPIVSANMNAVTGKRMAETMARFGGLGILPQDMALETVTRIVRHIKAAHVRFDTALVVEPDAPVRDVMGIIRKRAHDMVVVVDGDRRPVGLVTHHDLRAHDQYTPVSRVMTQDPRTLQASTDNRTAFLTMERERLDAMPVVDEAGVLIGVITQADAVRLELLRPAVDAEGRLMVGAALGISADAAENAARLVELGVDVLVLDTAHGHQRRMLEAIRGVQDALQGRAPLVAGNVCTKDGVTALITAGADIVKVNVGPGAMCTTRMQTGVGRPTFSTVAECALEARRLRRFVWADGGVRHPRDVALYLAAGAARVMLGTALAGTYESPGDIREDRNGRLYKENYGMASARAVQQRTGHLDPFERAKKGFFREGISSSRIYIEPGRESAGAILVDHISGLRSAFTYTGADDWHGFQELAVVGVQTAAGYGEGTAHGRVRGGPDPA